ncbi:MAG: glycosyltransferase [Marinobacter sp.]|uniref:glycosyltransferase family 2 protein n=1 Tax=Marinobacter sp. TaxID=50741 RepID=UPI00299DDA4D|nr:glycosyltransferase [Marinobacter sp.]MDX1634508.1 glycosyltransferase [Marinobacter sp.]
MISVVTPTYNRADFLPEAVRSVLDQTFPDFELLIVDDGSTDNTREVLAPFLEDPRVHYQYQANQGQSMARNHALSRARGRFICFLDSDNAWLPDKLEKQMAAFEQHPDVDVVYGDIITIDEGGRELSRENMRRYSGHIAAQMLRDNCVSMNTAMARRRCFDEMGGMSGTRRVADDYDLWLRFSARYRFLYLPEFFAKYRVMADQISSDKRRRFDTNEQIIHDFLRDYPEAVTRLETRRGLASFYSRKARHYALNGDRATSWNSFSRGLRYGAANTTVWRALVRVIRPR